MEIERSTGDALSRRGFLAATGAVGLSAALAGLPDALLRYGLLDRAAAAEIDLTHDTLSGFAAFVVPGNDGYSKAQGISTRKPGAIGAGAVPGMVDALDNLIPVPLVSGSTGVAIPASGGVATILNGFALQVSPAASGGGFLSPLSRLSFEEKGEVFRRFESDPLMADSEFRFLAGALLALVPLFAYSEAPVYEDGELTAKPVGWQLSGYGGPSEGWNELKGYYRGRRAADDAHLFVKHNHRRGGSDA